MSLHSKHHSDTGDKKQQIIETAERLILENGFANTSINLIQKTAEVSKGLIYYHFENKDDLGIAVLHHIFYLEFKDFEEFAGNITEVPDRSEVLQYLDEYLEKLFTSTMRERSIIQIIIDLLLNLKSTSAKKQVKELYQNYLQKVANFLEHLEVEEPMIHAKLVFSVLDGLLYLNMALDEDLADRENQYVIRALKCMVGLQEEK